MGTKDILIYESGNGGDMAIVNNDIALAEQLFNQVLLALFGGNTEADTQGNELPGQERFDWWGNALFFTNSTGKQFNSQTERALKSNALNSQGRVNIENAVNADLAYLKGIANVAVTVSIPATNRVQLLVQLAQPGGQPATLQLLWDNAKQEVIMTKNI